MSTFADRLLVGWIWKIRQAECKRKHHNITAIAVNIAGHCCLCQDAFNNKLALSERVVMDDEIQVMR